METTSISMVKKVRVEDVVISDITKKLYDYSNRQDEINAVAESMKELGQLEPIMVIPEGNKYMILDGVIRLMALKSLKVNEADVIVEEFTPTNEFSLTDFVIHHQIRKEKKTWEKLNEVRYILRIGSKDKNPARDKEKRVELVSKVLGEKGWKRNNVFSLENIIEWEDSSYHDLGLAQRLIANELKVNRANEAKRLVEENEFDVESEKESKIISGFLEGVFDKNQAQNLITSYYRKKDDTPTVIDMVAGNDNFQLLFGDAETVELPEDLLIDTIFTSPPYYQLRKYGTNPNELGWEKTPDLFVRRLADILMRGYDRLKETGSMFVNIGESYDKGQSCAVIPRLTLELIKRGAILNDTIIWNKPQAKPASSKAKRLKNNYEVILHFVKSKNFYYEPLKIDLPRELRNKKGCKEHFENKPSRHIPNKFPTVNNVLDDLTVGNFFTINTKNNRIITQKDEEEHPATFPWTLPLLPLLMSCPKDDKTVVFDPFSGTSSTGVTALTLGFKFVGVELYEKNVETSKRVLRDHQKEFSTETVKEVLDGMGYYVDDPQTEELNLAA